MSASATDEQTATVHSNQAILMYTTTWCGDCRRAKKVFAALEVPYTEINIDEDSTAATKVKRLNNGMQSVPTIVFPDGSMLVEPSNHALETKLTALANR